jgi:hypothetical protein
VLKNARKFNKWNMWWRRHKILGMAAPFK